MEILTSQYNIFLIISGVLLFLILINLFLIAKLNKKYKHLFQGKKLSTFEDIIISIHKDLNDQKMFRNDLEKYIVRLEKRLKRSVQGVHNLNFNAFKGTETGGKSFATALINENGDGVIISSLNARDRMSVFTKRVSGFKPEVELSEEEQETLTKATESFSL